MRRLLPVVAAALALAVAAAPAADPGTAPGGTAPRPGAPPAVERPRPARLPVEFVRAFTDRWGVPCREYVQHVFIGEETVEASGTVCRAADGSWILRR